MINILLNIIEYKHLKRLLLMVVILNVQCSMFNVYAQINIGGNVYGGGNAGDTGGRTTVTVRSGDIDGNVFGGARQANVGGSAFVHIDGEHMSGDILINYVYGGNDIAGTIGASATLPDELTEAVENGITDEAGKNKNNYNAFVLTTKERTETTVTGESASTTQPYKMYFGQLFGGGNGDYTYTNETTTTGEGAEAVTTTVHVAKDASGNTIASSKDDFIKPELDKAYIEMRGGSCVLLYGGGNNVTVKEATDICIDNPSAITYDITDAQGNTKLTDERLKHMGIFELGSAGEDVATSDAYQFSRVFGGNNKAPMDIRPTWHLKKGKIRNLYSGGNRGAMTHEKGILLVLASDDLEINNVYGGCRMADVNPANKTIAEEYIDGVYYPPYHSARLYITGGNINNVYGGNDISGNIYGGNAVGVHTSIKGNVYGGGNGSYPYTDNPALATSDLYSDFFYDVNAILGKPAGSSFTGMESAQALDRFRPHAEAATIRLSGTAAKPLIIGGAVYCGGNSATLRSTSTTAQAQLKIGSYVYANEVFLGSNGENMVKEELLERLFKYVKTDGTITTSSSDYDFSQMDLKNNSGQMAEYMKGCEMDVKPNVVFDSQIRKDPEDYVPYSTYFGSFYCGGNRGSVNTTGMNTIDFNYPVVIYDKLVAGSNNAVVLAGDYNARYEGGIIGDPGTNDNKLTLNLSGLTIEPKRWRDENNKSNISDLIWNVVDKNGNPVNPEDIPAIPADGKAVAADLERRLVGGNIYGGCCTSGIVNGNVIINVNATLMDRDKIFDDVEAAGEGLYGDDILEQDTREYTINERRSGVILDEQGMDVLGSALCLFGGGKGRETEIWGSTTVNLKQGFVFQVFGGSEEGIIGKAVDTGGTYTFKGKSFKQDDKYSCIINLRSPSDANAEAEFIYGGGFLGPVCGNTILNLGKGRVFNTFAGACNADILGHTETYMGRQIKDDGTVGEGFPYIEDYIYCGNDLGGSILGKADFTVRVRNEVASKIHSADAPKNVSAYVEYQQGHAIGIFGGCFGTYDYKDPEYKDFFYTTGATDATETNLGTARLGYTKPRMDKAFVNFRPSNDARLKSNEDNTISEIYGAGQGQPGDGDRDIMQNSSYILIDIPQDMTNFDDLQVWGAGAWSGLGMREYVEPGTQGSVADAASAIIDLPRGQLNVVYGGSYKEGFTRRTVVNVPMGSTVKLNKIFGGAYGISNNDICDVYEGHVNWNSGNALVSGLYGGNNNARRTLYGRVNVNAPVWSDKSTGYMATIYGAGFGENTWSQYTEVNLNKGSQVYMVYGGGHNGRVANVASTKRMSEVEFSDPTYEGLKIADTYANGKAYAENGLNNPLAKARYDGKKYNTNVIINKGAIVGSYALGSTPGFDVKGGYAYGGGMGSPDKSRSGDVNGTTYIALLGGTVEKDLVAAGSVGSVFDQYGGLTDDFNKPFVASATAYIGGGVARNVFGGGYMGSVGKHKTTGQLKDENGNPVTDKDGNPVNGEIDADISNTTVVDIPAEANIIIGIREDQTSENLTTALNYAKSESADNEGTYGFYNGIPAIQRNAYGGGEGEDKAGGRGGAVFGKANVIINNGRIGYDWLNDEFVEKLNDETWITDNPNDSIGRLKDYGNIFGGGYSDRSNVDETNVVMYGGILRGSLHGGAELAAIGRGATRESGVANHKRDFEAIYKAGKTHVEMYNGHVKRNVFGGGKGYNVLGFGGKNELYTDGYVFGQTEVYIYGGEVGTEEGLADNNGNVFGGGDVGFVYSKGYNNTNSRKTGTGSPNHYYYYYNDGSGDKLTEDCKVVISPYLQVKPGQSITYLGKTYNAYDYVPTEYLNTLPKKQEVTDDEGNKTKQFTGDWLKLFTGVNNGVEGATEDTDERGIHIRNGVFAGGNVSSNNDKTYANATTVFGNTTATLFDAYHRDFITVGTEHTGGIYGGGNLSVVDGYRELNITNYGTDYYGLDSQITLDEYKSLSNRERAYFQLQYICNETTTFGSGESAITYEKDKILKEDEYLKLLEKYPAAKDAFTPYGFCSIYAGRLLNTIQRADFCGVFGSRMVLQGAKDRVADVGEDIDYTINRVGEVSLNQQRSEQAADEGSDDALHGNYFGIYSVVNYMGNLTSDVHFGDTYRGTDGKEVPGQTYYGYKKAQPTSSSRNFGSSFNQVALASGVFLELTTENSTADHKDYGYVTGVIELDLINVKRDEVGGGFVYAKNEHRLPRRYPNKRNVFLSEYNNVSDNEAVSNRQFRYYESQEGPWPEEGAENVGGEPNDRLYQYVVYETSGNFIHPKKKIVDDCYPINNAYIEGRTPYSEAHYWYVKGDVYIYDQKVSAYTGSANAYSKEVHLPLTITAASHGRLQLLNVKPNLYAYYMPTEATGVDKVKIGSELDTSGEPIDKVWVNNESDSYELNDVITWWDWHQLSPTERSYFVTQTYVNCITCTIDGKEYEAGTYVMDDADFTEFKKTSHEITNAAGNATTVDFVFRSSNNIGHDTGYVLTLDMNSPKVWDDYYTAINNGGTTSGTTTTISKAAYKQLSSAAQYDYREGPTFRPLETGVYGQRQYEEGAVITEETYTNSTEGSGTQATMEKAYVAFKTVKYTYKDQQKIANPGTPIPKTEYDAIGATAQASFGEALMCTSTVKLSNENYMLYGDLKTQDEINQMKDDFAGITDEDGHITGYTPLAAEIQASMTPAYICSSAGGWGGKRLENDKNYDAITAWCSLPKSDRIDANGHDKFTFNYDGLDLINDADYLKVGNSVESPSHERTVQAFHSPYTDLVAVEYSAVFDEDEVKIVEFNNGTSREFSPTAADADKRISNEEFENVRNDQRHYTRVSVKANGETIYIAKDNFVYNGIPYGKGQVVEETVATLTVNQDKVDAIAFTNTGSAAVIKYYCYEDYGNVTKGTVIDDQAYIALTNHQKYFVIQGQEPTETTTLYVSRESDIYDLTKKKVITVVYQYTYYEDEDDGSVKLTNELHVVNIHLELESGVPQIGQLNPPSIVLPGDAVGLRTPEVKPGLYEILTNGWELYDNYDDAVKHQNGTAFVNNSTPVFWYQNQKAYVAFYSKTYLGFTYSNPVPVSVANYHDLDKVMLDKEHHMYVDHPDVERDSKIYIDNRECKSDATKSELDLLKDFFDLSVLSTTPAAGSALEGHALLNRDRVQGGNNLEFFLRSNVSPKAYTTWNSIGGGENDPCFSGTLHGDGYTIGGLSSSLFGKLCGNVYNLGVMGSFTGAGVAETGEGYVENCWVKTSGTPVKVDGETHYAVFGNPTRGTDPRGLIQVENCYYPESNDYQTPPTDDSYKHGRPTQMPDKDFYNGEVAYNLNGFYLKKRYYDKVEPSGSDVAEYLYLKSESNTTLPADMSTAKYPAGYAVYQPDVKMSEGVEKPWLGYVENRFYDGDYRYANGEIPTTTDIRVRTVTTGEGENAVTTTHFTPIWPDDYIFFGQALTYGHVGNREHQATPSRINKSQERILTTADGNRVYRAPAYFRSKVKDVAHFNPYAIFAQTKKDDPTVIAYKDMTAIDFSGGLAADETNSYEYGLDDDGHFFHPLLDDDGLTLFQNMDLTRNLLVYTGAPGGTEEGQTPTASQKTANVVSTYLHDEAYEEINTTYHTVAPWNSESDAVRGHWVQKVGENSYVASLDHLLVDLYDFNCPIPYTFASGKRMWYQRKPDNYVGMKKNDGTYTDSHSGWNDISLPFKAEIVTTNVKGEITHFYGGSKESANETHSKVGHEYWLRELKEGGHVSTTDESIYEAILGYPDAKSADGEKEYTNTFLWDYYYSWNNRDDLNQDDYQIYYKADDYGIVNTFEDYPRLAAATPYIIGFPGERYYEFDLSGKFKAETTLTPNPTQLGQQTITFASAPGATIGVSDEETKDGKSDGNYTFKPNYLNQTLTSVAADDNTSPRDFVLNTAGNAYEANLHAAGAASKTVALSAFRPYFTTATAHTRSIIFGNEQLEELKGVEEHGDPRKEEINGGLRIWTKKDKIFVESTLSYTEDVRVVTPAGITVAAFSVKPGQTVEVQADFSGMYIVHTLDGRYTKKLSVKK
jgi:hypothetical protein